MPPAQNNCCGKPEALINAMDIVNPVLPGFNPDPSFLRVGQDYYLATSTFEWYPGVQIHHSTDLVNWKLVARPLNRQNLLDMRGNPDSGGVWAPCLSYSEGRFWLVYTDVKRLDGSFKDTHNYITTCERIDGEWTDPWYVNSSGFDPSLFHDTNGEKYFLNMRWNHRSAGSGVNPANDLFDGILLQSWSPEQGLYGEVHMIYPGSELGLTEAPHLFKRQDWYYLTVAEGGTGYEHAVTMARSRQIQGPYETHPEKHLFHVHGNKDKSHPIQRTGHGQYVETHWGSVYHSFLMGRPIHNSDGNQFCPLGRESGLERCVWKDDGWLYAESGDQRPRVIVPAPTSTEINPAGNSQPTHESVIETTFNTTELPGDFQWLRTPHPDRLFNCSKKGLVLFGRESIGSWFEQALVARRQQHLCYTAHTEVEASPRNYQQAAGLITYYNRHKFHALLLTSENGEPSLTMLSCAGDYPEMMLSYPLEGSTIPLQANGSPNYRVQLKVEVDADTQQFAWRYPGDSDWQRIGPTLDATMLSDEGGRGEHASFTGTFCGMIAFDLTGTAMPATFPYFTYQGRD